MNTAPALSSTEPVATALVATGRSNPFQGLAYFESTHAASFAGRARDIQELTSEILRCRKLILYGRSGLGKTSLVLAGVLPKLQEHRCKSVYVRTLLDPERELFAAAHEQLNGNQRDDLRALIRQHDQDGPVVIVFDQFEEFFIRFSERPNAGHGDRTKLSVEDGLLRVRFVELVSRLAHDVELDLRLVFSLREDWFAEMESFEEFLPNIMRSSYRLLPLTAFGVRESITRVLRVAGIPFEPQLVSGLVEQLAEAHFDPAVLQVMCTEVWAQAAKRSGDEVVRLELRDLVNVGTLGMVFSRYLDQVTARLPHGDARFALQVRAVLAAMITPQHTKHAAPRAEFLTQYFKIDEPELERVLALLRDQRLVRRDARRDGPWYELIHERLIRSILNWLERDAEFFQFRDALNTVRTLSSTAGWVDEPERLLNKGQLEGVVGPYKALLNFAEHERRFLLHSAIYSGSDDIEYWIAQNDAAALDDLIRGFLGSEYAEARRRGAQAVERFASLGRWTEAVRGLALTDPDSEVRQGAARAFAQRAPDAVLPQVAQDLRSSPRPPHLLALAAEVVRARGGRAPLSFGPYWSWRARRHLYRQRLQERAAAVAAAHARVFLPSLCASVLAGLTLVPVFVYTVTCVTSPKNASDLEWLGVIAGIAFASILVSSVLAWRMGRRAIAWAVRYDQQDQFATALRLPDLGWLFGAVGLFSLVMTLLTKKSQSDIAIGLSLCLLGPTLMGWSSAVGGLARASVVGARSVVARWAWSAIWSLGATLAPALCAWVALGTGAGEAYLAWLDRDSNALLQVVCGYPVFVWLCAPGVAVLSFVGLASISLASPLPGQDCDYRVASDPHFSLQQIRRERWVGAALLAAAAAAFFIAQGFDVFPWTARVLRLDPGQRELAELSVGPDRARQDSAFLRLQLDGDRPGVVRYRLNQPPNEEEEDFGLYAAGSSSLPPLRFKPGMRTDAKVSVELLPQLYDGRLRTKDWQFYIARYDSRETSSAFGTREWRSTLDLKIETDATELQVCVTLQALWRGKELPLVYGSPTRADREKTLTPKSGFVRLPDMIRSPGNGRELADIWHEALSCDSFRDIRGGQLRRELPRIWLRKAAIAHQELQPGTALQESEPVTALNELAAAGVSQELYLLFLVRGISDSAEPGEQP